MNSGIDINQIKQNAVDIKTITNDPVTMNAPSPSAFTMGPIDLGQKTTNKFFNNLEDQAANMQMTEAINPFSRFNDSQVLPKEPTSNSFPQMTILPADNQTSSQIISEVSAPSNVESLDSLDFAPPKEQKDILKAKNRITSLLNELRSDGYLIEYTESNIGGKITYHIEIKETEN